MLKALTPQGRDQVEPLHCSQILYLYRGTVITACESGGWDVWTQDELELGWGRTIYEAQAVANEYADGDTRRKSK